MGLPSQVIHDLPAMTYGGLKAYVDDIETSFSHTLATRDFYGVDGAAHEWTRREPIHVSCTAYFLNTIAPNEYPQNWSKWRQALLRGDARQLKHPEVGVFYARPTSTSYTITSKSTAGVVVRLEFVESIESSDDPSKLTTNATGAMAQAAADADYAMAELGIDYPDGMPEPTFEETVNAIGSLGFSLEAQVTGKLAQLQGLSDAVFNAVQSLAKAQQFADGAVKDALAGAPLRWLLESSCNTIRVLASEAIAEVARGARKTVNYKTTRAMSLAAVSFEIGADIGDLIALNPSLLNGPIVDAGQAVVYYAGA